LPTKKNAASGFVCLGTVKKGNITRNPNAPQKMLVQIFLLLHKRKTQNDKRGLLHALSGCYGEIKPGWLRITHGFWLKLGFVAFCL
jgi:hypothetical protein